MNPEAIRALRTKHQLTRVEFARLIWSTPRAVTSWEQGQRPMPAAQWELALIKLEKREPYIPKIIDEGQGVLEL